MTDKNFRNEQLNDNELDKVAGGTGGCGKPDLDDIQDEKPPTLDPVTPPKIPPIEPAHEVPVVEPPIGYR